MRCRVACLAAFAVASGVAVALPASAQQAGTPAPSKQAAVAWSTVTYISAGTIYIDAGRKAGLKEGARVEVVRRGQAIAQLTVAFISSTRSACTVVSSLIEPAVGDSARFTPVVQAPVVATTTDSTGAVTILRTRPRHNAIRGRLGMRYMLVQPGEGLPSWTQPAFDLRLDGHQVGGTPLGVVLDVRAYRQRSGATGRGAAASTRVYQGNLEWGPSNGAVRLNVGRQLTPSLSNMGIFDGMSLEVGGKHLSVGAVGGAQPDAATFGLSGIVKEYGAYVQAHNAPSSTAGTWQLTLAGIGAYDRGQIDREFVYAQALVARRHVSLFATQEVDVNRQWKADIEGKTAIPTSTFAVLRLAPIDAISFNVGYDNRRSVRLYRDFIDPVTEFDDSFRQGGWAGVTVNAGSHVRLNTDARQSRGGTGGDANSYTGSLGVYRLTVLGLGAQVRGSQYTGSVAEGQLVSGSVEVNPWNRFHLEASGGTRTDKRAVADLGLRKLTWQGLDADFGVGRSLYLMFSSYLEKGDAGRSMQGYAALSWRF